MKKMRWEETPDREISLTKGRKARKAEWGTGGGVTRKMAILWVSGMKSEARSDGR